MAAGAPFLTTGEEKETPGNPKLSSRGERLVLVKSGRKRKEGSTTFGPKLTHQFRMSPWAQSCTSTPPKEELQEQPEQAPMAYPQLSAEGCAG